MRIAIGSTLPCKVEAVKEAWQVFGARLSDGSDKAPEYVYYDVSNGGPPMPLTVSQLMEGARARVENLTLQLKRERAEADFYVGLEGGFNVVDAQGPRRLAFLESWAYVSDGHRASFGHGGGLPVPSRLSDPVIDRGIELGIVIDRLSQETDLHSEQGGTWGLLTRDILSRKHSFVIALIAAFAPFYNSGAYE